MINHSFAITAILVYRMTFVSELKAALRKYYAPTFKVTFARNNPIITTTYRKDKKLSQRIRRTTNILFRLKGIDHKTILASLANINYLNKNLLP